MSNIKITDLSNDFLLNPLTGDVSIRKDVDAIKQSMKNLLLLEQFDKPFNPSINANLKQYLFESIPFPVLRTLVTERINTIISTYEPRVEIKKVEIQFIEDINTMRIDITFTLKNSSVQKEEFLQLNLERLR